MITTKEVAKRLSITAAGVHYWIPKMPKGMAQQISPALWLFSEDAVQWIINQRALSKPGRKPKNEKKR